MDLKSGPRSLSSDSPCMFTHLAGVTNIRAGTICFEPPPHRRINS